MSELQVRQFEPEDVLAISAREPDASIMASLPDPLAVAKQYRDSGPAWTGLLDGQPMVCSGVVILWPGLAEGWALTSSLAAQYPLAFHRVIKHKLNELISANNLRRVQVAIPETHQVSCRWITHLGFNCEGIMPKYGPDGADYLRFARLS
jgi:hypothetical protein